MATNKGDQKLFHILADARADGRAAGRPVRGVEDAKIGNALCLRRVLREGASSTQDAEHRVQRVQLMVSARRVHTAGIGRQAPSSAPVFFRQ